MNLTTRDYTNKSHFKGHSSGRNNSSGANSLYGNAQGKGLYIDQIKSWASCIYLLIYSDSPASLNTLVKKKKDYLVFLFS